MQPLKATFLVVLMVLSSLAGCISGEESEKESEEKINVTGENETIEQVRDIVAACSGESSNSSECNVETAYGVGDEPLAPIEFSSEEHSTDEEGHDHPGLDNDRQNLLTPPIFPDKFESNSTSTSGRSCTSSYLIGMSPQDLVTYLISSTDACIYYFWYFNSDIAATITNTNVQHVANEIISLSSTYQGDNSQGIHQLLFFLRVSWYHSYYQGSVTLNQQTFDFTELAATSLEASPNILDSSSEARKILNQLVILADTAGFAAEFIPLFQTILDTFMVQNTLDQYYSALTVYSVFYSIARTVDQPQFNADQGLPVLLARIAEITVDTGNILIPNGDVWAVNWAIWSLGRVAYTSSPNMYSDGCQYIIDAENHHYDPQNYNIPFFWALDVHEYFYSANCVNQDNDLSLEGLMPEIEAWLFPNTYSFDNGRIIIRTPLGTEDAESLYYAMKEVFAQFFRLSESKQPVANDQNYAIELMIYGTRYDYQQYQPVLYNLGTNNGGIYIEQWGRIFTYERLPSESIYTLEELVKHEYAHYLVGRHLVYGNWGLGPFYANDRITWFEEGLAEYLAGSTKHDGVLLRSSIMNQINNDGNSRLTLQQVTDSSYNSGFKFYRYANLLIDFLVQNQDHIVRDLMECMYLNDVTCYDNVVNQLLLQPDAEIDYQAHIDDALLLLSSYGPPQAEYISNEDLNLVETYFIEEEIGEYRYGYGAECDYNIKTSLPRFRCTGTFYYNNTVYDTTDRTWSYFNTLLDGMMSSMADDEDLNNLQDAVCWFDRILIEPTVRDEFNHSTNWHCEVPVPIDGYPVENTAVEQMLEDISRTKANSTVDCYEPQTNMVICRIGVESIWFESDADQSVMIENLHHFSREIINQIHASSPVLYSQYSCTVSDDYQYQDVGVDMWFVSSEIDCQWTVNDS